MTIIRFLRKSSAVSILAMLAVFALFSVVSAVEPIPIPITATINLDPNTINLESNGKWITAYIELPVPYDVRKIDKSSVTLNVNGYVVTAELKPSDIGDHDRDGKPDLMLKFDRQTVQSHLFAGSTEMTVSGTVNGADFEGSDTINAMAKGINATILQTSDVHDHASGAGPFLDYTPDGGGNDVVRGGYARLATVIETVRARQAAQKIPTLLVDSGDWYMGTTYDMTVADPVALRFFQLMDYDAITLGNHEFDWSPDGLAKILQSGLTNGFTVPVVATNTIADPNKEGDDNIESLMAAGVIVNKKIIDLPNGLKIGLLGLVGPGADKDAPVAPPITFNHSYPFIQDQVNSLRKKDNVDLVAVLSHGGIEPDGTGDDADLAEYVTGIDIVASGHYHTATHAPIVKGSSSTIIFSPGEYGEYVSRLDFTYSKKLGRIVSFDFTLLPVDDTVAGDAAVQYMVNEYNGALDTTLNSVLGLSSGQSEIISKTNFDLKMNPVDLNRITGLGSLCADSLRAVANKVKDLNDGNPYDLAIVGSGVIRDPLLKGNTGNISFADVYNCLPLGISPDTTQPAPGFPLMSIYVTGLEIYIISEVGLTMSTQPGYGSFYLNFSGSKIEYNVAGAQSLKGVQSVSLYAPGDFLCTGSATSIAPDETLYHVVVDLYALQLLNIVNGMINPYGLSIIPKDKAGDPINFTDPTDQLHYMNFRIDFSPADGVQELKEWMALWQFLNTAFPESGLGIPADVYDHTNPAALVNGRVVVGP
jgi:5'-nucleotidase / UDP-sugar diphosphatase